MSLDLGGCSPSMTNAKVRQTRQCQLFTFVASAPHLARVFSPAVRNSLDSTYYEIVANFFASVFNYTTLSRGISLTMVTLEFTQYMCLLLLFTRILAALMAKMLDGPQYTWVAICVSETILECLRITRPRDQLLALPTREFLLYTFPFLFLSLR